MPLSPTLIHRNPSGSAHTAAKLFAHVHPIPGELTEDEIKEYDRLLTQRDDLAELDQDEWNEDAVSESERVETRLEEFRRLEDVDRAVYRGKGR